MKCHSQEFMNFAKQNHKKKTQHQISQVCENAHGSVYLKQTEQPLLSRQFTAVEVFPSTLRNDWHNFYETTDN